MIYVYNLFSEKMDESFRFPHKLTYSDLAESLKYRNCMVVSFFGKAPLSRHGYSASFIDEFIGRPVFTAYSSQDAYQGKYIMLDCTSELTVGVPCINPLVPRVQKINPPI